MSIAEFTLKVQSHNIRSVIEYHSDQIMRVRLYGNHSTMLLENDWPRIRMMKNKKALNWKFREGEMQDLSDGAIKMMALIILELERTIKTEFPAP